MRLGIALRLIGVLVLGALVALSAAALKHGVADGNTYAHYTVMLKSGEDAQLTADDHADEYGLHVDSVSMDSANTAYIATIPSKDVDKVRSDEKVSYLVLDDKATRAEQPWWDDVMINLGLRTPHFN